MDAHLEQCLQALPPAIDSLDETRVASATRALVEAIRQTDDSCPLELAWPVLERLRARRWFNDLRELAEAFIDSGQAAPQIRRLYAQALIEQGKLRAAIDELESLRSILPAGHREHGEACGLLGRAFKQRYVNADNPTLERTRQDLARAIALYEGIYLQDRSRSWHGINAVALLCRAARDGLDLPDHPHPGADAVAYAQALLASIQERRNYREANLYDYATAAEALLALDRGQEAAEWLTLYVGHPGANPFELASTRRQLVEVWRLDRDHAPGAHLLPLLEAALIGDDGGQVVVGAADTRHAIAARHQALKGDGRNLHGLEKVLGFDTFQSLDWIRNAQLRALGVARIGRDRVRGEGTGFLIRGSDLYPPLGEEMLLLTNAHVISSDPRAAAAIPADEAIVVFEAHDSNEHWEIAAELWTSPPDALDATLLRLNRPVTHAPPYPLASSPPLRDGKQRVFVIGHPAGGSLAFSLQDSLLLDHELPLLHYRTPTEPGSSGSPVFNASWRLIGIHHKGSGQMQRLNGATGTYGANEGIFIGSIRAAIMQAFSPPMAD